MTMDSHQCLDDEGDETQVLLRGLAWGVKQCRAITLSRCETPVVVLT